MRRLALIACALAPSAPLAAQDRGGLEWSVRGDESSMTLAYEMPDTDDVRLGLTCDRGSSRVTLWRIPSGQTRPEFRLSSGRVRATFPGTLETLEMPYLSAPAPARAPVLQRFLATGELALTADGAITRMNATRAERDRIGRFFQHCGRRP